MKSYRIPFPQVDALSAFDKLYSQMDDRLSPFYNYKPSKEGLLDAIDNRSTFPLYREELVQTLLSQYENIGFLDSKRATIERLAHERTFTVTTAHQLNILTGPLYYIYKILTIIKLAKKMNESGNHYIIPVFVLGGEDHDFDEIDHAHIYSKELKWNREKSGAVGRMNTDGLADVLAELYEILGENQSSKIKRFFDESYLNHKQYGHAVQRLISDLFSDYDLLVLNMDDHRLKKIFTPVVVDEVQNLSTQTLVNQTADRIEQAGIKVQVRPRDINLFYLSTEERLRISSKGGQHHIVDSERSFTVDELTTLVQQEPQNISPNVLLRPLYQEMILPNIAFIGGGGELAYWIELMSTFAHHNVHYPVLIRRKSVLWIDKKSQRKMDNLELPCTLFFNNVDHIIRNYIEINSDASFNFEEENTLLKNIFEIIKKKGKKIDQSLVASLEAEQIKWQKSMSQVESRLLRAEKKNKESAINQIRNIKEKLFPKNGLQERHDNFLPLYLSYGPTFFDSLLAVMDPFDSDFLVVVED